MTYKDFLRNIETDIIPNRHPHIREGQAIMNYLGDIWIEEYKRITALNFDGAIEIDCFYSDRIIPKTLSHLEKVWINFGN